MGRVALIGTARCGAELVRPELRATHDCVCVAGWERVSPDPPRARGTDSPQRRPQDWRGFASDRQGRGAGANMASDSTDPAPLHLSVIAWTTHTSTVGRARPALPRLDPTVTLSGRQGVLVESLRRLGALEMTENGLQGVQLPNPGLCRRPE